MQIRQNRRDFLVSASLAAAAGVLGPRGALAEDGPPETTTIKLAYYGNICLAPLLIAKDLLHAEGFTDVRYVEAPDDFTIPELVARGECHFGSTFAGTVVYHIDNGVPITALSGVHAGCYELFAQQPFRSITELRGKRVVIKGLNSDGHQYLAIMAAHVGLDPKTDFEWVISPGGNALEVFARGEALVAVLLLPVVRCERLRQCQSDRHQALSARAAQGCRLLCSGAGPGRPATG
jgi:NitT/TauT family transport system substrate-binding protein